MFRLHSAAYFALGFLPVVAIPGHELIEATLHCSIGCLIVLEHHHRHRLAKAAALARAEALKEPIAA